MRESQRRAGQLEDELGSASPPCADAPPWALGRAPGCPPSPGCPTPLRLPSGPGRGPGSPPGSSEPASLHPVSELPSDWPVFAGDSRRPGSVRGSIGDRCPARALGHTLSATWFLIQAPLHRALPDAPREPRSPGHASTVNLRRQASVHFQTGHLGTDWPVATECSQVPGQ